MICKQLLRSSRSKICRWNNDLRKPPRDFDNASDYEGKKYE